MFAVPDDVATKDTLELRPLGISDIVAGVEPVAGNLIEWNARASWVDVLTARLVRLNRAGESPSPLLGGER